MAFNQNYKHHTPPNNTLALSRQEHLTSSSLNTQAAGQNTSLPLSTSGESGVQSDWILFEPDLDRVDILSTSNIEDNRSHDASDNEADAEEDDYDDDDDSLLESLETENMTPSVLNELNLASSSSANYTFHANDYAQSLQNDDFINTRIDCWRKEQAKVLIDDLYGLASTPVTKNENSETETGVGSNELLVSWGVEETPSEQEEEEGKSTSVKRFYGDDLLKNYTPWEISKISKVSKTLSSSLRRDPRYSSHYNKEASFLFQLSHSANKYTIQDSYSLKDRFDEDHIHGITGNDGGLFWEQDFRSIQSSITSNSVILGNLALDVI